MGIITKGMGIVLKKGDDTIKSVKPKFGKEDTKAYKFDLMKKKLNKNIEQLKGKK